ncbi:MAG: 50S ribosomal protein L32e [Promethearchaeota archaeon]
MKKSKHLKRLRKELLLKRKDKERKPEFRRSESWRYKRVKPSWRRPIGIDSKIRENKKGFPQMPSVGYRSPAKLRNLHPSGLQEVLVHTIEQLNGLHPTVHAVRIASRVGDRKRLTILERADDLGLRVLNPQLKSRLPEPTDIIPTEEEH